jgi:hypothetical protein
MLALPFLRAWLFAYSPLLRQACNTSTSLHRAPSEPLLRKIKPPST